MCDPPERVRRCELLQYDGWHEDRVVILQQQNTFLEDKCCSAAPVSGSWSHCPGDPSSDTSCFSVYLTLKCDHKMILKTDFVLCYFPLSKQCLSPPSSNKLILEARLIVVSFPLNCISRSCLWDSYKFQHLCTLSFQVSLTLIEKDNIKLLSLSRSPPIWQEPALHFHVGCCGQSLRRPLMNLRLGSWGYMFCLDVEHLSTCGTFIYICPVGALINTPRVSTLLWRAGRARRALLQEMSSDAEAQDAEVSSLSCRRLSAHY